MYHSPASQQAYEQFKASQAAASSSAAGALGQAKAHPPTPYTTPPNEALTGAYNQSVADSAYSRDLQINENKYQRGQLSQEYGIDDASNPFSKMVMLQEAYERNKANTDTGFASQGNYFSGAHDSNQALLTHGLAADKDSLAREYKSAKHGLDYSDQQANASYGTSTNAAALQKLRDLLGLS
jgi:hypothetical protein